MTPKEAIEWLRKQTEDGDSYFDFDAAEIILAMARDMLTLGEARKELPKGHIFEEGFMYPNMQQKKLAAFIVTAANLAQKWGGE